MAGGQPTFGDYARAGLGGATDMATILAHGITFGLNDKVVHALTGADAEGAYDAARARTGLVGDIGSVAGLGGGAKVALGALGGVRAALPTIAKAVISKKGLAGLGLGLGSLAEYNARTSAEAAPTPKAAAPAAKQPDVNAIAAKIAAAHTAAAAAAPANDFSSMIQRLAAGQGGAISLRQLGALSESAQRGSQADYYARGGSAKGPNPGDLAGHMLEQQYIDQFQKSLGDPKADAVKAQQQFEDKVLQLRKTQFIDPYGLQSGAE